MMGAVEVRTLLIIEIVGNANIIYLISCYSTRISSHLPFPPLRCSFFFHVPTLNRACTNNEQTPQFQINYAKWTMLKLKYMIIYYLWLTLVKYIANSFLEIVFKMGSNTSFHGPLSKALKRIRCEASVFFFFFRFGLVCALFRFRLSSSKVLISFRHSVSNGMFSGVFSLRHNNSPHSWITVGIISIANQIPDKNKYRLCAKCRVLGWCAVLLCCALRYVPLSGLVRFVLRPCECVLRMCRCADGRLAPMKEHRSIDWCTHSNPDFGHLWFGHK